MPLLSELTYGQGVPPIINHLGAVVVEAAVEGLVLEKNLKIMEEEEEVRDYCIMNVKAPCTITASFTPSTVWHPCLL